MDAIQSLIDAFIRDVSEMPDRSSPSDWPDAMLVTGEELNEMLHTFVAKVLTSDVQPEA